MNPTLEACGTATDRPIDFSNHPCFSKDARKKYGRIHLPVAPRCNIQCNFCNRKYDCLNESRPGVSSAVLTPQQALAYLGDVLEKRPAISVMGIAGPGDPFANPDETMETLRLTRKHFPKMILCVATNGLNVAPYVDEMAELRVSHVTLTINAVDPEIGGEIYAWVRDGKRPLRGAEAAAVLGARQIEALVKLKARGITVKVNTIIMPGINDDHIPEIARKVSALGADIMNLMPLMAVKGAEFEDLQPPDATTTARLRLQCGRSLPQMTHCARCRADAVGYLGEDMTTEQHDALKHYANSSVNPAENDARPFAAVATMEGVLVNQHLGEADRFVIYEQVAESPGEFRLKETRLAPPPGGGDERWADLAESLKDCRALLVNAAGPTPMKLLMRHGLRLIEMEGLIDEGLRAVFADKPIPAAMKRRFTGCGAGITCKGTGTGCG
ncbi:MAG: nitrogenase cofactor biosynthesis protein NifB [Candidatus Binataceae bacterium]|jgi:nitrogen fixation protein NifB